MSTKGTIKQFRWFWAWDDEKEEDWLRDMSQKGWHFKSVSFPGNYIFEKGEPVNYVYRLDHFTNRKDMPSYLQIFEDAGWDYLGEMNSWQYFRQEAIEGQTLEIFTDNESKASKYQRIMLFLIILLPIFLNMFLLVRRSAESGFTQIISAVMGVVFILYTYVMMKLLGRITQLRK